MNRRIKLEKKKVENKNRIVLETTKEWTKKIDKRIGQLGLSTRSSYIMWLIMKDLGVK